MERARLKTLFLPFRVGGFNGYYERFRQRVQNLEPETIEQELQIPTYTHQLRDMLVRTGVGLALVYGTSQLIQPTSEPTPLHILYLLSLGPQGLAISLLGATRNIMIRTEQTILQEQLASR